MSDKPKSCLTCKWAEYDATPTGRLRRGAYVKCTHPPTSPGVIAIALAGKVPQSHLLDIDPLRSRTMWPDTMDFGASCACHEPREKGGAT